MNETWRKIGVFTFVILGVGVIGWLAVAGAGQEAVSSRAYVGHETDAEMNGFIRQYPAAASADKRGLSGEPESQCSRSDT